MGCARDVFANKTTLIMSVPVKIAQLSKKYGDVNALNGINLDISSGEIFGFIGPDGSGKTSLFRVITSLILPDSGNVSVGGLDVVKDYKKIRKITGYMPGRFSLYPDLTVVENLEFYARIFHTSITENYDLIEDIYSHIEPFKMRRAGALSGGMKQKLALSCALIHKPRLLILDEPTTGVDAVSRKEFWGLLKKMQEKGITILVSTPYMDEASLCDKVALMQNGNLLAVNSPEGIIDSFEGSLLSVKTKSMHTLIRDLESVLPQTGVYRFGDTVHVTTKEKDPGEVARKLESKLTEKGHENIEMEPIKPVIEDCFLELMDKTNVV